MSEPLRIELLGGLRVSVGDAPTTNSMYVKSQALLAYLAMMERPQRRDVLAGLLWSELPDIDARANLRVVLTNLRKSLTPWLAITRESVAFDHAQPHWLDVATFETEIHATRDPVRLRAALDLYRGDFLAGVHVPEAPLFEEWMTGQRERLRHQALVGLHVLANLYVERRNFLASIDVLSQILVLDPWQEEAHQQLMLLLAQAGQRSAALAQYETCRRILQEELGAEPSDDTRALFERIRTGEFSASSMTVDAVTPSWARQPSPHLPASATEFIGREMELAQVVVNLADPACRLLTLVGPGGVGKTRLAVRAAMNARDAFPDGVWFVSLADVSAPDHVIPTILATLDPAGGTEDPIQRLQRALETKVALLVLDNLEHLVGAAPTLNDVLGAATDIKLLVTSRERLALQAEWLLPIEGLPLPDVLTDAAILSSDAVQLFLARARQIRSDLEWSPEMRRSVAEICHLVGGLPLAIELAAAWTRVYDPTEILTELRHGIELLATSLRDVPARHRSLRAVFEHSWALLDEPERIALARLSVFPGEFSREAARAITGASAIDLSVLVDKSLVRRTRTGRYSLHALVRDYAHVRLEERGEQPAMREQHATYYVKFLIEREGALKGAYQDAALRAITAEIGNIRLAWQWAIERGDDVAIGQLLDCLGLFFELHGWLREGADELEPAVATLKITSEDESRPRERRLLLGRVLSWQARFNHLLGRFSEAGTLLQRSMAFLDVDDSDHAHGFSLENQGNDADRRGQYDEARRLFEQAIGAYERAGDHYRMALALNRMGGVAFDTGTYDEARMWCERSLAIRRTIGDENGIARDLGNLGEIARIVGEYDEAHRRSVEALALTRQLGDELRALHPMNNLGLLAQIRGDYQAATTFHEDALTIARDRTDRREVATSLLYLAQVASATGERDNAAALLAESLMIFRESGYPHGLVLVLNHLAQFANECGRHDDARRYATESRTIAEQIGDRYGIAMSLVAIARADIGIGSDLTTIQHAVDAFEMFAEAGAIPEMLNVMVVMAGILTDGDERQLAGQGIEVRERRGRAVALLEQVAQHPMAWHATREVARVQLGRIAAGVQSMVPMTNGTSDAVRDLTDVLDIFWGTPHLMMCHAQTGPPGDGTVSHHGHPA